MSALGIVRAAGGELWLGDGGKLKGKAVPDELVQAVKDHRDQITQTLAREAFTGVEYADSKIYFRLSDYYDAASDLEKNEYSEQVLKTVLEMDDALHADFKSGCERVLAAWPEIKKLEEQAQGILRGERLMDAIKDEFGLHDGAGAGVLDMGAFA